MITEFCMNCGAKIEYALDKPNFCSSCGTRLNESAQASVKEPTQETKVEAPEENSPNISQLEYSIQSDQNKLTFGDLVSQASQDSNTEYKKSTVRPKAQVDPQEDVIKSTMQQCRSKREPEDIGG
jgi:predicted amidophosphoribosyltransferase